jgi:hypothetical protein
LPLPLLLPLLAANQPLILILILLILILLLPLPLPLPLRILILIVPLRILILIVPLRIVAYSGPSSTGFEFLTVSFNATRSVSLPAE